MSHLRDLKFVLSTLALLSLLSTAMAQQDDASSGTIVGKSVQITSDGNGNGVMSVITDGVQQDFVLTPDGPVPAGGDMPQGNLVAPKGVMIAPGGPGVAKGGGMVIGGGAKNLDQVRRSMSNALRQALGCSDEEWAVLAPKIEKVQVLQSAAGEPSSTLVAVPGAGSNRPLPDSVIDARTKVKEFEKLISDTNVSDTLVTQALSALRESRKKMRTELVQARKELTDLLTPRQEAVLYQRRLLEQ